MCAIDRGKSVDTTMGFSPQSGLENATRHGDLDVFAVLFMMERHGWTCEQVRDQLAKGGGLAGLSGIAGGDVRDLERAAAEGDADAAAALGVFVYQVKKTIGAYAAAMGGLDAVAFTGGIGENSARLRTACCEGLEFLGISLDAEVNRHGSGDRVRIEWKGCSAGAGHQRRIGGGQEGIPGARARRDTLGVKRAQVFLDPREFFPPFFCSHLFVPETWQDTTTRSTPTLPRQSSARGTG